MVTVRVRLAVEPSMTSNAALLCALARRAAEAPSLVEAGAVAPLVRWLEDGALGPPDVAAAVFESFAARR